MAYAKKTKSKVAEVEEIEEELDDLEETEADEDELEDDDEDEDEEEAPAPKKKAAAKKATPAAKKAAAKSDTLGVGWLCELIEEKTGKSYTPQVLRVLLRKMNDSGELGEREAKTRYAFAGEKDPVVVAILKRVKGGAIEAAKKESLDKLKAKQAEKKAAAPAKKAVKRKPAPVEDDDFEDDEDDDE